MQYRNLAILLIACFLYVHNFGRLPSDWAEQLHAAENSDPTEEPGNQESAFASNHARRLRLVEDDAAALQARVPAMQGNSRRTLKSSRSGWTEIWSDEFDEFSRSNWGFQTGDGCQYGVDLCGWGNQEKVWYTDSPKNVRTWNGKLVIQAREETGDRKQAFQQQCWGECVTRCQKEGKEGQKLDWCINDCGQYRCPNVQFTSGRIRTKGRFSIAPSDKYNVIKIAARIKVPHGKTWPAFWLLPEQDTYGTWPLSGEIDVMEYFNDRRVVGTAHYGYSWPRNLYSGGSTSVDVSEYHTYSIEWEKDEIRWYVDGQKYYSLQSKSSTTDGSGWFSDGRNTRSNSPFDQPFYIILNLSIGGTLTGNPSAEEISASLQQPKRMVVDWIRVYGQE